MRPVFAVLLLPLLAASDLAWARPYSEAYESLQRLAPAGQFFETELHKLDQLAPKSAALSPAPWGNSFWAFSQLMIADRAADPGFTRLRDKASRLRYLERYPARAVLAEADPAKRAEIVRSLSAAEKYDLWTGDAAFSLTQAVLEQVRGASEYWAGICDGAAAAAVAWPEPVKEVLVPSRFDPSLLIPFTAWDIKALAALLWSSYVPADSRLVGRRCESRGLGARMSDACADLNPASWHVTVVSRLGQLGLPLISDIATNLEVWNQALGGYRLTYFNVKTGKESLSPDEAVVRTDDFSWWKPDRHRRQRTTGTASIVGVRMDVQYVRNTDPRAASTENEGPLRTARYEYDLELDGLGRIIGGEWYSDERPDFVWAHAVGALPEPDGDRLLGELPWNAQQPIPEVWINAIRISSQKVQPSRRLVEQLVHGSAR